MVYEKQNFEAGQILEAEHLNNIEDGIVRNEEAISNNLNDIQKINEELATKANTTDIPNIDSLASEKYVDEKISTLINSAPETLDTLGEIATAIKDSGDVVDALNEAIGKKANTSDLSKVATSGSYNDLTNRPTIPTVDVTKTYVDSELAKKAAADHAHDEYLTYIPTEYITETELENKGYLTYIPTEYVTDTELNNKGYLTSVPAGYATETYVTEAIAKAQLEGEEVDLSGYATKDDLKGKADTTHTHDNYLTEVPSEYITETELNTSLGSYATTSYVDGKVSAIYKYKGSVANEAALANITDKVTGDVYNLEDTGMNVAWTGSSWDKLGATVDLTNYALKSDIPTNLSSFNNDENFASISDMTTYIEEHKDELKGEQGIQGEKGENGTDGSNGTDGVSCTHSWSGTTLTVTSASGTTSSDLKGDKGDTGSQGPQGVQGPKGDTGADGYTPIKGTDYYTDADKQEMVSLVLAAVVNGDEVSY